ncbi:CaiB/BaiF CoA transferase family protein [Albidovulum sp.]|jgi:CoA:oxalate CoA-transferase|uniref:CaiB/BaiF CoA transferase family protein n=1 Tax=Albidovulum sp. TaxID=1872424 RepID=UPI00302F11AF
MTNPCLTGIRVLDLTRVLAGPFCTALLADLGAEVIKIETPAGDDYRHVPPLADGTGGLFRLLNRGKKSVALDLRSDRGREIVRQLAQSSDILVENFRPGVMDSMGLGHGVLAGANPGLIHVSISGFGRESPMGDLPAYDLVIQALTGFMGLTGEPDGPPTMTGESIADLTTGLFASWAALAALIARGSTGKGQFVDVAMYDCLFNFMPAGLAQHLHGHVPPVRVGNRHPLGAPFGVFRAQDGHYTIAVLNPRQFARLTEAMGRPGLAQDPRFSSNGARHDNHAALKALIEGWSGALPVAAVLERLRAHDVPASPILTLPEAVAGQQVAARDLLPVVPGADGRAERVMAQPARFSAMPARPTAAAPGLGADGPAILAHRLGLRDDEIARLVEDGILHDATRSRERA